MADRATLTTLMLTVCGAVWPARSANRSRSCRAGSSSGRSPTNPHTALNRRCCTSAATDRWSTWFAYRPMWSNATTATATAARATAIHGRAPPVWPRASRSTTTLVSQAVATVADPLTTPPSRVVTALHGLAAQPMPVTSASLRPVSRQPGQPSPRAGSVLPPAGSLLPPAGSLLPPAGSLMPAPVDGARARRRRPTPRARPRTAGRSGTSRSGTPRGPASGSRSD